MLETLQRLLTIEVLDLETALNHSCNLIAETLHADKVDAFLYQPEKDTLFALGTSTQPLSALQRKLGLDVLPVSNGGRVVQVFQTGRVFVTGRLDEDPEELRGVKQAMKIRSKIGVPLEMDGHRRGMVMIASLQPDFFTDEDVRFSQSVVRWVAIVARKAELTQEIARNAVEQGRRAVAEELITVLAHDLRNFIAPITARLQLLRRRAANDGRDVDRRDCDMAERAASRLNRLITDLLDVARLDQGVFQLDRQPVDLGGIAQDAAAALARPDHDVQVDCAEQTVVAGDTDRIRQVIENVIANALRYSPRDAPVYVTVSKHKGESGEWGRLEVRDQGPGIPAEILPKIFERFASGHDSPGLGLGLYLAKRIAASHGGDLTVQSEPGMGARFVLLLPGYVDTNGSTPHFT
jgi:two-component system OmpR family sensor kinase